MVCARGVGGYFGGRLVQAGADVTFLARGAHLDALTRDAARWTAVDLSDPVLRLLSVPGEVLRLVLRGPVGERRVP